jgi:hypothetical protein
MQKFTLAGDMKDKKVVLAVSALIMFCLIFEDIFAPLFDHAP